MKFTIHTEAVNGGAFNCAPAMSVEMEDDRISIHGSSCSPDYPGNRTGAGNLYLIGNEFGALGVVCADNEPEAIDELVDNDLAGGLLIDECSPEEEEENEYSRHGNGGELCDLTHAWIRRVSLDPARDIALIVAIAKAGATGARFLSEV